MPGLHELQRRFGRALLNNTPTAVAPCIQASGLSPARRLGIYRNNVFTNLRSALRTFYPVVDRLVGAACFDHLADAYIRHCPSPAGDLNCFGAQLADLVADFPALVGLDYLPDVARLEWQVHRVYHAADHAPLDREVLARVPPDEYGWLRFRLHPATALMASDYPVHRIWQVNQPGYCGDTEVRLDEGGVCLLIERRGPAIELQPLSPGEWALLQAMAGDQDFAVACEAAFAVAPDFDLQTVLGRLIAQATLVDVQTPDVAQPESPGARPCR